MKSIIVLNLLFSLCAEGKEIQNCDECEKEIEEAVSNETEYACEYCTIKLKSALENAQDHFDFSESSTPNKVSIPDCETCDLWILSPPQLYADACISEVNSCYVQIAPMTLYSSKLKCDCELNTDKGTKKGGIHGIIENPKFSMLTKSCTEELGDTFLHEDSHIGADKLHITCDGDEDFLKACEEESHNYNVDNVIKSLASNLANKFLGKDSSYSSEFDCRDYYD